MFIFSGKSRRSTSCIPRVWGSIISRGAWQILHPALVFSPASKGTKLKRWKSIFVSWPGLAMAGAPVAPCSAVPTAHGLSWGNEAPDCLIEAAGSKSAAATIAAHHQIPAPIIWWLFCPACGHQQQRSSRPSTCCHQECGDNGGQGEAGWGSVLSPQVGAVMS